MPYLADFVASGYGLQLVLWWKFLFREGAINIKFIFINTRNTSLFELC